MIFPPVSKFTGLWAGRTATVENLVSLEIAPLNMNYDLKTSGHYERTETPKFKVQLEYNNKNQRDETVKASYEFQHISRSPLKLQMEALLATATREIKYNDRLEEVAPNEFKGRTQIQWDQDKKSTVEYTYRIRSDSRITHHELDAEVKTPNNQFRHQALIRSSASQIELKSKLQHERQDVWTIDTVLSRVGKSSVTVETREVNGKFEITPVGSAKSASLEVTGKSFSHNSNAQSTRDSFVANSKTVYNQKPILVFSLNQKDQQATRVQIESPLVDARFDCTPWTRAKWSVNLKPVEIQNEAEIYTESNVNKVTISSKLQKRRRSVLSVDITVAPHDLETQFQLNRDKKRGLKIHHEIESDQVKCTVKYLEDGKQVGILENFASVKGSSRQNGLELIAAVTAKSEYEILGMGVDEFHFGVNHKQQVTRNRDFEINTALNAHLGQSDNQYQLKVAATKTTQGSNAGRINLKCSLQTPHSEYKSQSGVFQVTWDQNKCQIETSCMNNAGKALETKATIARVANGLYSVTGDLKSDYRSIPSMKFEGQAGKKSFALKADVDAQNKIDIKGSADYKNMNEFSTEIKGRSAWTPEYYAHLKAIRQSDGTKYEFRSQEDQRELCSVDAVGSRVGRNGWKSSVEVSRRSSPLVKVTMSHENRRSNIKVTCHNNYEVELDSNMSPHILTGPHDFVLNYGNPRRQLDSINVHHEVRTRPLMDRT